MKAHKQRLLAGIVASLCLSLVVPNAVAGKPPKPTPTPTPTPTPPAPCETCTIAYILVNETTIRHSLMVMDEWGSSTTELFTSPPHVQLCEPAWSPDGRWIAFNSKDTYYGNHRAINVISSEGGTPTEVALRCSVMAGLTRSRGFGPSWQPVDDDGNGMTWLVYADALSPDDGTTCISGDIGPDNGPLHLWAIEVGLGNPVTAGRRVPLTYPDPENTWAWDSPVWSGDGSHLAAVRYPAEAEQMREVMVFDVRFTDEGLPYLENPGVLTFPQPVFYPGEPTWAHWSNRLIATANPYPVGGSDLWLCDVEHDNNNNGEHTCGSNGWTNVTPDIDSWFNGARFSNTDDRIVTLKGGSQPRPPYWEIWVGILDPITGLTGQAIKRGHAQTFVKQPDWRPRP